MKDEPVAGHLLPDDNTLTPAQRERASQLVSKARFTVLKHDAFSHISAVLANGKTTVAPGFGANRMAKTDGWNSFYHPLFVLNCASKTIENIGFRTLVTTVLQNGFRKLLGHCNPRSYSHSLRGKHIVPQELEGGEVTFVDLYDVASAVVVNTLIAQIERSYLEASKKAGINAAPMTYFPTWSVQPDKEKENWSLPRVLAQLVQDHSKGLKFQMVMLTGLDDMPDNAPLDLPDRLKAAVLSANTSARIRKAFKGGSEGVSGDGIDQLLGRLARPKNSYMQYLRSMLKTTKVAGNEYGSWARVDRRHIGSGMLMPGMVRNDGGSIAFIFDTSGSCFGDAKLFASEMQGLLAEIRPSKVHVLFVDSKVQKYEEIDRSKMQDLSWLVAKGNGWTDMRAGFDYLDKHKIHADAVVVLTDGETPFPTEDKKGRPSIWVVTDPSLTCPVGRTVFLDRA